MHCDELAHSTRQQKKKKKNNKKRFFACLAYKINCVVLLLFLLFTHFCIFFVGAAQQRWQPLLFGHYIHIHVQKENTCYICTYVFLCVCVFFCFYLFFFFINNINVGFSKRNVLICCWLTHSEISFVASHNLDSLCLFALVSSSKAHMCYTYKTLPGHYNEMLDL